MIKFPKTICISLPQDEYRREFVKTQTDKLGIDVSFIDGVDGHKLDLVIYPKKLKKGEVGIAFSHFCALNTASILPYDEFLILEDDAVFCDNFLEKFNEFYSNLPENWDIAYLGFIQQKKSIEINQINQFVGSFNVINNIKNDYDIKKIALDFILTNHAYLVKKTTLSKLKNFIYPCNLAADLAIMSRVLPEINHYISTPMLINQATYMNHIKKDVKYKNWKSTTWIEKIQNTNESVYCEYGLSNLEALTSCKFWRWTGKIFKFKFSDKISKVKMFISSPIKNKLTVKTGELILNFDINLGDNQIFIENIKDSILGTLENVYTPIKVEKNSLDMRSLGICIYEMELIDNDEKILNINADTINDYE